MKKNHLLLMNRTGIRLFFSLAFLCVFGSIHAANSNAQNPKDISDVYLTVNSNNSISQVLRELEEKTDYQFTYNESDLQGVSQVNLSHENKSMYDVLVDIMNQTGLHFKQVNRNISVTKPNVAPSVEIVQVEDIQVSGDIR